MKMFSLVVFVCLGYDLFAQNVKSKPIIDTGMLGTWPSINGDAKVSANGKYIAFTIGNKPVNSKTLVVKTTKGNWHREFVSAQLNDEFYFTANSKLLIFQIGDSLVSLALEKDTTSLIDVISSCKYPTNSKGNWISYKLKNTDTIVILTNLITGSKVSYDHANNVLFNQKGTILLVESLINEIPRLNVIELGSNPTSKMVWNGKKGDVIKDIEFDNTGDQICFLISDSVTSRIYYLNKDSPTTHLLIDGPNLHTKAEYMVKEISGFSGNNKWIFIKMFRHQAAESIIKKNGVSVDIWSYKDEVLNPTQGLEIGHTIRTIDMVISPELKVPVLINDDGLKTGIIKGGTDHFKGDYLIVSSDTVETRESWWTYSGPIENWLVSLRDGKRIKLPIYSNNIQQSPSGKWLLFWVGSEKKFDFLSYDISTGKLTNITATLPQSVALENMPFMDSVPVGVAEWYDRTDEILIYDNYDIWKLDLYGAKKPVCLTNQYGFKNGVKLRIVSEDKNDENAVVMLTGFNEYTKWNGFYKLATKPHVDPELLIMAPFSWFKTGSQVGNSSSSKQLMKPIEFKVGKQYTWLLMGESSTEFTNYYQTKDFKNFTKVSDLKPQRNYNWLTTELVKWKLPDGKEAQGVLYKPENFDSTKCYPIIFNYYERNSGWMYAFRDPRLTGGGINIPWFVSRGYLLFQPDIYFSVGRNTGISSCEHAYNSVVSAAIYLTQRNYIDKNRMAIQGHSFGGLLTNYLLTHSKIFAAAAEGAGFSDEMSSYLTLVGYSFSSPVDNMSTQEHKERDHALYGATPWERPDLYRKNSPVWDASQASAPLLIFHNKKDKQVQWRQGVEMYMALRRLGKPCWMLQYDNSGHVLSGQDSKDYTIRLTQFFDHFLKSKPAPKWMTKGILAELKGIDTGYQLDANGNCGIQRSRPCIVCEKWNQKFKAFPEMFTQPELEWDLNAKH